MLPGEKPIRKAGRPRKNTKRGGNRQPSLLPSSGPASESTAAPPAACGSVMEVPQRSSTPRCPGEEATAPGIRCVGVGRRHQGQLPSGYTTQCVIMSACAVSLSVLKDRALFTEDDIDVVLYNADRIYADVIRRQYAGQARFLLPDGDVPAELELAGQRFTNSVIWITNGLYPGSSFELQQRIGELVLLLGDLLAEQTNNNGFFFTGLGKTKSFWGGANGKYYLFDSHAVGESGQVDANSLNRARLFEVDTVHDLAQLLLLGADYSARQEYSLHRMTILNREPVATDNVSAVSTHMSSPVIAPTDTPVNDNVDRQLSFLRPVVVLERLEFDSSGVPIPPQQATRKRGRPAKVKPGAKKRVENPHLTASLKYNADHPEVNRAAVQKYTAKHPEMNRTAVDQYQESHCDKFIEYQRSYNVARNVFRGPTLLGQSSGDGLNSRDLKTYTLKKPSLIAAETFSCPHCNAKLFEEEKTRKEWCCGRGRFLLVSLPPIDHEPFYSDRDFLHRPRAYNNIFAFSSLGVTHGFVRPDRGFSFIKIQGRTYHYTQDLICERNPINFYIHGDRRNQAARELNLDQNVVAQITAFMTRVNPFIPMFRRLSEVPSDDAFLMFERTSRATHGNILGDMPGGNEIAAIISTDREEYVEKSVVVWKVGNAQPHYVDLFNECYEPLQYPLLYPHGTPGWSLQAVERRRPQLDSNNDGNKNPKKVSQVKYYRCLLLSQPRFSTLGHLNEEWACDMYCRTEEERLRFIKFMQEKKVRAAPADEIARVVRGDETVLGEGAVAGKVYLPNTFTGGPRYMKVKYMDAISIVNRLGKPSFFLTITCNRNWKEIKDSTLPNRYASSMLCARVFQLKLAELLRDLRGGSFFGKSVYIMHVIEFQKRGLPHAHICFRVDGGGPVQNSEIDKFVRADIPSEEEAEGRLRPIVLRHMVHGPCGVGRRTDLACWDAEKGKCAKRFPKIATDMTHTDSRGFVNLKRDPQNRAFIRYQNRAVGVSDLWIVPYNAALLLKYDCHINLEIASTRKIVKYLFKYMTKGPDEARVALVDNTDNEVENYATKRYIGACEAVWRILEYDLTAREPNVKQLPVHLEKQELVYYKPGNEADALERSSSDLIKYFKRPQGAEFDSLTYQDFYEQYNVSGTRPATKNVAVHFIRDEKCDFFVWKRQRKELVARLFFVAPTRGEQFYLRVLLANFPSRGYSDLIARGGPQCETFQDAARALGLADDELEYETAMIEAATFFTGRRLRHFFVLIITNGTAPGAILWEKMKDLLSEDYLERHPKTSQDGETAYRMALVEIDRLLRKHGSRLTDHGLPAVTDTTTELRRELEQYYGGRLMDYVDEWLPRLSPEQKRVFDYVNGFMDANRDPADENEKTAIFLDGPAGTGKTLLLNVIVGHIRGNLGRVALCTASSGIAALNYEGGCTAHSMFRFPLHVLDDNGYWGLTAGTQRAELIREASLIVYDEAPMAHKYLIHLLDRSLRDLMGNSKLFGGKVIILAGDFRQIPPVVPTARNNNDIVQASLKTSPLWSKFYHMSLTAAQRTRGDANYSEFLLNLGNGQCDSIETGTGRNRRSLISLSHLNVVDQLGDLLNFVFPVDILHDSDACARRAILSTHNVNVRQINNLIIEMVPGDLVHCYSVDKVDPEHMQDFQLDVDMLNRVQVNGVPDHDLHLKVGSICMIMRNLSFVDRLVNGTKVIIVEIVSPRLILVRKPGERETYCIPRITFKADIEPGSAISMVRNQFPLTTCYAMTVHKAQGQTIEHVGVDLRSDIFSHGQLYVALGRVRDQQNIMILIQNERFVDGVPYVNNVVIPQLLNVSDDIHFGSGPQQPQQPQSLPPSPTPSPPPATDIGISIDSDDEMWMSV